MMAVFSNNFTLALIKEVGENDLLLTVNGEDIVVELSESNRQPILDSVTDGIYLVPFDSDKNELLMTIDEATLYEAFPEAELSELVGATDEIEEEE